MSRFVERSRRGRVALRLSVLGVIAALMVVVPGGPAQAGTAWTYYNNLDSDRGWDAAVRDYNNNGRIDEVYFDLNNNGRADVRLVAQDGNDVRLNYFQFDTNEDGFYEHYYLQYDQGVYYLNGCMEIGMHWTWGGGWVSQGQCQSVSVGPVVWDGVNRLQLTFTSIYGIVFW